ncbi:MAG TPA: FAD-dependent monooxygenase [Streptosporangiaceae bacterium]|nr:FAD-dependent monooxygenase [Streptosporangiaceae bacterium]
MPSGAIVIVGAGPTGLILAAELALAGVRSVVLERRDGPRTDSRAICIHARTMEAFDLRGLASVFATSGLAVPSFPLGPRGARIKFGALDSDFPYLLDIPQSQVERLLLERATGLGAEVRWSTTVTAISQDDSGVTVTTGDGGQERADYVAGCDGVRSFVRDELAIPFPGIHNPGSVILADLRLGGLPMDAAYGDISRNGMLLVFPFRDGTCRVVLYDYARADVPVTEPVTLPEVVAGLRRVVGEDFSPDGMYWSGRYRSESRQVPYYRSGRVLLAGDAAHAHSPAGAQGMNTGLQDAMNLGWKLAAQVGGWAPDWLLDSYHAERHPVGADVLALTGRQFRLNVARTVPGRVRRWAVHRLLVPLPPVQSRLAREYSGVAIRYPAAGPGNPGDPAAAGRAGAASPATGPAAAAQAHPLTGFRLPPGTVTVPGARSVRLAELFHDGKFVLLSTAPGDAPPAASMPPGRVTAVAARPADARRRGAHRLPAAALVRPDGYVAWATDEPDPARRAAAATAAIRHWCTG